MHLSWSLSLCLASRGFCHFTYSSWCSPFPVLWGNLELVRPEPCSIGSFSPICWLEPFAYGSKTRGLGEEHRLLHLSSQVIVPEHRMILLPAFLTARIFFAFTRGSLISIVMWSTDKPGNSITWAGFRIDFFLFMMNSRHSKRYNIPAIWSWIKSLNSANISISSMYVISLTPVSLRIAKTGFRVLLNTQRANDRPKSRHLNC